jgi:hypothetical protein
VRDRHRRIGRLDGLTGHSAKLKAREPGLASLGMPAVPEGRVGLGGCLTVPGGVGSRLRGSTRAVPGDGEALLDLPAPLGEQASQLGRDTLDLGDAVRHRGPTDAERPPELVAQVGLEQEPRGAQRRVQASAVQGAPLTVGRLRGVGDEHVPVELRIPSPAGAMAESGGHEAGAVESLGPVVAEADAARVVLQPPDRSGQGHLARGDDAT